MAEELYCWEGDSGLPSVSTDCLVVLAYAQFAGAPLKLHKTSNPWRSPSGSFPALRTNQKETLSRPSDIIIHLRKQKYNADYDLSAKEGADSLAFISLLEEKLTPALIYMYWVEPKNYVDVTRRWYAEHMPFPFNFFLPGRMQRTQLDKLRLLRGDESLEAGEELEKELFRDAAECMNLLSQRLGSQKFFFGDSPSSLDAYVFGHLAPILKSRLPNAKLQQHLKTLDNLTTFCSNILLLYFPRDGPESSGPKTSSQPEGGDFDHVPNKRRKQFLSVLVALGAMLSYALLTGMVSIQHAHREALEEPPDLRTLRAHDHEEEEEEEDESSGPKTSSQPEGGDFDHVPNKRRKQFLSVLVALGAMLSYALLTGMVSIQHAHREALEEPPDLRTLRAHDHEEEEEEEDG